MNSVFSVISCSERIVLIGHARDFYCPRHTFISLARSAGENSKASAEQCVTSSHMIEQRYSRYMSSDVGQRLMAEIAGETEIKTKMGSEADFQGAKIRQEEWLVNDEKDWRPRRDLNPLSPHKPKREKS